MSKPETIIHMNGAGNSFLVIDALKGSVLPIAPESRRAFAKRLCRETSGLVADGLIFLDPEKDYDFRWDFYNDDGSSAEMCGNASRCMTLFYGKKYGTKNVRFKTMAGEIRGEILSDSKVRVWMPKLPDQGRKVNLSIGTQPGEFFLINTGVPHVVVPMAPNMDMAKLIRRAPELGEAGANVTFYEEEAPGKIKAVTFERGVENYTLACGTGATAAAVFAKHQSQSRQQSLNEIDVQMPGGLLHVSWDPKAEDSPILTGPAEVDFEILSIKGASL